MTGRKALFLASLLLLALGLVCSLVGSGIANKGHAEARNSINEDDEELSDALWTRASEQEQLGYSIQDQAMPLVLIGLTLMLAVIALGRGVLEHRCSDPAAHLSHPWPPPKFTNPSDGIREYPMPSEPGPEAYNPNP